MSCQFKEECPSYSGWCEDPKQDFSRCISFLVTAVKSRDGKIADLKKAANALADPRVLYLCDRRSCQKCNPDCFLTSDIRHAVNFELNQRGHFTETRRPRNLKSGLNHPDGDGRLFRR